MTKKLREIVGQTHKLYTAEDGRPFSQKANVGNIPGKGKYAYAIRDGSGQLVAYGECSPS